MAMQRQQQKRGCEKSSARSHCHPFVLRGSTASPSRLLPAAPSVRVAARVSPNSGGEDHAVEATRGGSQRPDLAHDGAIGRRYSTTIESGTKASSPFINADPPSRPIRPVGLQIGADGRADRREEELFAEACEKSEALQLVLDRVLQLGKAQLDARRVQGLVQFGQHVGGGDVDAGDRLGGDDQPAHRRRRCRHGVEHALLEQLGIGEEQRRVPAEQDQAGDQAGVGIARDVVVALDAVGPARAPRSADASRPRGIR